MKIREALQLVESFQVAGQQTVNHVPTKLSIAEVEFRDSLMQEEVKETRYAGISEDLVETLDGLADQLYVLLGTVNAYGLQEVFTEAFERVHKSNQSKLTGGKLIKDKLTGKILKPDTFIPVYLNDLV